MATPTIIKAQHRSADSPPEEHPAPSPFEVGRAKIEQIRCFRLLELYGTTIADAEFQKTFRENLARLNNSVAGIAS